MYAQTQSRLDKISREQSRAFEENELGLQRAQIKMQQEQALLNETAQDLMLQQQGQVQREEAQSQRAQLNAQTSLQNQKTKSQLRQANLQRRAESQTALGQNQLQLEQQRLDIEGQRQGQLNQANQQQIAAESQAAQAMGQIAADFEQAGVQQNQVLRQQAAQAVQLAAMSGNLSMSDRALLDRNVDDLSQDLVSRVRQSGRAIDDINSNVELQRALGDYLTAQAESRAQVAGSQAETQFGINRNQILNQRDLSKMQTDDAASLAFLQSHANRTFGRQGSYLRQLLGQQDLQRQGTLGDIALTEELGRTQEDLAALDVLEAAQRNRYSIADEQQALNEQFYDTALSSQRLATQTAGAAEQAALQSRLQGVRGAGFLSSASQLAQAGMGVYSAFQGMNRQQPQVQPTNPFYSSNAQPITNPGFLSGSAYTNAGNYQFDNSINVGGGYGS
jgi:hypothetical protein